MATTRKSAPFRVGAIFPSPIPAITAGRSLAPRSCARYAFGCPCGPPSFRSTGNSISGLPRSVHATGCFGFCLSAGGALSACSHQAGKQPTSSRLGRAYQSLWPSQLDDVYNGSLLSLTLHTQPSAYPDAISGVTPAPSRELASREGATLSERFAPGNYFPRTAPLATGR
jgi:hypothetical protein